MTSSSEKNGAGRFFGSFMRAGLLGMVSLLLALSACSSKGADSNATNSEGAGGADAGVAVVTSWPHSFVNGGSGGAGGGLPTGAPTHAQGLTPEAVAPRPNPIQDSVRAFIASHPAHAFPAGAAFPPGSSRAADGSPALPPPNFAPNTVKDLTTCTGVTLTSDHPTATYDSTGQYVVQGQTIVWTATGTCPGTAQYQFLLYGLDHVWTVAQDWSSSSTFSWNTTGLPTGFRTIEVLVRSGSSGAYEAYTTKAILLNDAAQCSGVAVSSDHPYSYLSYAVKGDTVRWTATSACAGQLRYKFLLLGPGATSYVLARDWSTTATFDWNTAGLASGYWGLLVFVSNVGFDDTYYETYISATAIVNDYASCTSATVTSDDADSYAVPGQQVHWTATSTCGGPAEYRWVFDDPSGVWHELQAWGPNNTFTWDTTNQPVGLWNMQVWVRDAPFYDYEQAYMGSSFVLNSSQPCLGITSTPTPSVVVAGTPVAVHSAVTNCTTSEYLVYYQPPGGSWQIISPYSPANANYVWDSTGAAVGTHTFEVWTRTQGAVQEYQTYGSFYVTVIAGTGISTDTPTVENFNILGTAGVAALPTGWRIDKQTNPNTVGSYSAAPPQTELNFGASASPPTANGIYNFGAGVANAQASNYWLNSTDRAPGWFSAGSDLTTGGTKSGNLYVALKAPPDKDLSGLDIGYDIKKFSAGTNPSGFRVQLFSSTDGQSWTSAGSGFLTAFAADASNAGFDPAPGTTTTVPPTRLTASIPKSNPFYLAWNYAVNSSGSNDGSNAQALAIDNVSIKGAGQCLPNCGAKHCGDDPADGCGHTCTIVCQDGEAGCTTNASCNPGSTCTGKAVGSTTPNVCQPPVCLTNPRLGGCGFVGAPCGATCTSNPTCHTDQDCSSGYVCGNNNGYRYGVPGVNVCEKPACETDPVGTGCGSITSECGTCTCTANCSTKHCGDADLSNGCGGTCLSLCANHAQCTANSDCQAGAICIPGAGERVGLAAGTNACLATSCTSATLAAPDCGTPASPCGICPSQIAACGSRECGVDPTTGIQCGAACPNGQYCSATGQCATIDPTTPIVVHDLNGGTVPLTAPTAPQAASVGATPGEFSVSERGSATYVVPVQVAPGRAGIEPNLSVRYSSSTGNGALGVGWSLDGLSTIDRCQRTFAQDGYTQPVTVTPADAFCLDGHRLVSVGTDEYRTEVDTFSKILVFHSSSAPLVPDHFKVFTKEGRILYFGDSPDSKGAPLHGVPRTWALSRVEDHFGNFMRIVYRSTLLNDPRTGETAPSEMLPDSISYTGHDSVEGDRQLKFDYSTGRPDAMLGSEVGGGIFSRDYRLDQIEVRAGNAPLRSYDFTYGAALNGTSRLNSLQECAGSGTVCKPATQFTYFDEVGFDAGTLFQPSVVRYGAVAFIPMGTALHQGGYDRLSGLNATSTTSFSTPVPGGVDMAVWAIPAAGPYISAAIDLINLVGERSTSTNWYVRTTYDFLRNLSTTENPCGATSLPADHVVVDSYGSQSLYETCPEIGVNAYNFLFFEQPRVWMVDVDGDGVQDKLFCDHDQLNLNYKLSQNEPLHGGTTDATDATKDGQILAPELCAHELDDSTGAEVTPSSQVSLFGESAGACQFQVCAGWRTPVTAAFDVDGDGTGNLLVRKFAPLPSQLSTWEALVFDATGPHFKTLSTDSIREIDPAHFEFQTLDFNGDGLRDILALPSRAHGAVIGVPILWENTGSGLQLQILDASGDATLGQASSFPDFVLDYDHDGTEELIAPNPGTTNDKSQIARPWIVRRIRNNHLISEEMSSATSDGPGFPGVLGDFDGDGNPDLITQDPEVGYYIHRGSGRRQSLLQTLTDGLGNFVSVRYDNKSLEGGNTYGFTGGRSSCTWPTSCPQSVQHPLVSSYTTGHYLDSSRLLSNVDGQVSLSYNQAYADSAGLGWLGFDSRTVIEKDGAGQVEKTTTVNYRPLESSTNAAPFTPPYTRPLAGVVEATITTLPHADSLAATHAAGAGYQQEVRTRYTWQQQMSAANRPFAALTSKTTQVSEINEFTVVQNGFNVGFGPLFDRKEDSVVDAYGNVSDLTITEQDYYSSRTSAATGPIPGSQSVYYAHTTYQPTAAELDNWLINLPKAEDSTDRPHCVGPIVPCPETPKSRHSTFQYYDNGALHFSTREQGDPTLQLTTELIPDSMGNIEQMIATDYDGTSRSTLVDYDDRRLFPISITNAKNQLTQIRIDDRFGKLAVLADANEIDESWAYDEFGRLRHHHGPTEERDIDYEASDFHSSDIGLPIPAAYHVLSTVSGGDTVDEQVDPVGHICQRESSGFNGASVFEEFWFDQRNRLARQTRPHLAGDLTQSFVRFDYDALNRITTRTGADGAPTQYGYAFQTDLADELVSAFSTTDGAIAITEIKDPLGHVTLQASDRAGRTVKAIDALNQNSEYTYGAYGALQFLDTPVGDTLRYTTDAYGRVTAINDPAFGGPRTRVYNGFDEVVSETDPTNRSSSMFYDELGRIDHVQDPDGLTRWTYDGPGPNEIGRLIGTVSSSGQQTSYTYEPRQAFGNRGLLASTTELLTQPGSVAGAQPTELVTGYHYDAYSRLSQIDYPGNASTPFSVKYGFDSNGHVIQASDAAQASTVYWQLLDADQGYRVHKERLGNGVVSVHTHDPLTGSTQEIFTTTDTQSIQGLLYFYNLDGNMIERDDLQASSSDVFDYDALHRLGPNSGYTYDSRQGRLKHQDGVGDYTYVDTAGRDWVKTAGDYTFTHDDGRGNITTRSGPTIPGGTQEITYTSFDLPSRITIGSGDPALFAYDASGTRAVKQVGTKSTFYAGDLYQATQNGAAKNHRYMVYVGGQAVAAVSQDETAGVTQSRSIQYLHADALGSVQAITASDGTLGSTRAFSAFGNSTTPLTQSSSVPYGYTGQEHDPELGLINMHGRMYDPVIGQFLSPDPVMQEPFSQGFNRFAYTFNSPVNFTDPSGYRASNTTIGIDIGIGATYTGGLIATVATAGGGGAAVGVGAGAVAAEGAGAGLGVADGASIAAPIVTIAMNAYFSSHQPVTSASTPVNQATRSSAARESGSPSLGQVARNPIAKVAEGNFLGQALDAPPEDDDVLDSEVQWGQRLDPLPRAETNVSRVPILPIIEEMNQRIAEGKPAWQTPALVESPDVPCVEPLVPREGEALYRGTSAPAGMAAHHLLPSEFQAAWESLGLNHDDFRAQLLEGTHQQIHSGPGMGPGGYWNATWRVYFADELGAGRGLTQFGVFNQLGNMVNDFGIDYYSPLVIPF